MCCVAASRVLLRPQIPQLLDFHFKDTVAASQFGHVNRNGKNWYRIAGDKCLPAHNTRLMEACPPEVDAADGKADGLCPSLFGDHLPWNILIRVAHCTLLQEPPAPPANARVAAQRSKEGLRVAACSTSSVWNILLGLPPPAGK
jgi:hypothetical protein